MVQAPQLDVLGAVRHKLAPLVFERVVLIVLPIGVPGDAVDVRERVPLATLADGDQAGKHASLQLRRRTLARARELVERRVRSRPVKDVHGVVEVVGDAHQPLAILRKRQADHRGRALERELRDPTLDLPSLLVHGGVPDAHDRGAGRAAHLPGGHDALIGVHRHALDVVVVPVEKVLLVHVPVKHDAHGGGVVHGVVVLVVEQVVGGVGQAAVAVDPLQGQTLLGRLRRARRQLGVPGARRVDALAAGKIFYAPAERVVAHGASLVRAHASFLHGDDPVPALQRRGHEQVHRHAPGSVFAVLGEKRVGDFGRQTRPEPVPHLHELAPRTQA